MDYLIRIQLIGSVEKSRGECNWTCGHKFNCGVFFLKLTAVIRQFFTLDHKAPDALFPSVIFSLDFGNPELEGNARMVEKVIIDETNYPSMLEEIVRKIKDEFDDKIVRFQTLEGIYEYMERKPFREISYSYQEINVLMRAYLKAYLRAPDFEEYIDYKFGPNSYWARQIAYGNLKEAEFMEQSKLYIDYLRKLYADTERIIPHVEHYKGEYDIQPDIALPGLLKYYQSKKEFVEQLMNKIEMLKSKGEDYTYSSEALKKHIWELKDNEYRIDFLKKMIENNQRF